MSPHTQTFSLTPLFSLFVRLCVFLVTPTLAGASFRDLCLYSMLNTSLRRHTRPILRPSKITRHWRRSCQHHLPLLGRLRRSWLFLVRMHHSPLRLQDPTPHILLPHPRQPRMPPPHRIFHIQGGRYVPCTLHCPPHLFLPFIMLQTPIEGRKVLQSVRAPFFRH